MKVRTRKLVAIGLMLIFVLFACAALIMALNSLTANAAFAGYGTELSKIQLYNNSNTYNVSDIEGNEVTYDFNSPNGKTVMEEPQITVLTPGLGGTAAHWSNAYPNVHKNEKGEDVTYFAYSEDSIIHQLYMKADGDAYVYWAKINKDGGFNLYDIINVSNEEYKEDYEKHEGDLNKIERIEDVSKPIIIVFESSDPVGGNDTVYYEFNHMLSNIVYDVSLHNPGKALPKVNLIGHSRGGITNLQYALDHPDLVDKLISLGTPYLGSEESLAFGEMILGWSEGLEDINTLSLTDGYLERWNSNYEWLYSDIDVTAIGSIASIAFVAEAASMFAEGTPFRTILEFLIDLYAGTLEGRLVLTAFAAVGSGGYALIELFWPEIQNYFSYEQVGYVWDILWTHIDGVIDPMWLGDILVPVDSALGDKDGKTYKGFNRIVGTFDKDDGTDFNKRCVANVPVPHNLITMDQRFIDLVLNEISFDDAVVSEFSYTEKQDGTIQIDRYYGVKNSEFVIPSVIDGKTVSEISSMAFAYAFLEGTVAETISIPATVTEIGDYAFLNNAGLKQVVFESGSQLERIGHSAFSGCSGLTSIALPAGVEEIGSMAFADCSSLTGTFTLPTAMTDYGACAFVGCDGLTAFALSASNPNYSVANGVLYDEDKTSLYCYPAGKSGSSFVVPDTVTTISEYAFYGNESLSSVDLANVTTIREGAFGNCIDLGTVLSEKANIIEGLAFAGTEWYETHKDFAVVGNVVYSYQDEETDVDFSGYFSVSPYAALGNSNIETITFDNAARNIGAFAFAGCENLDTVYLNNLNNIIYVGTGALEGTADHLTIYVPQRILDEYEENELWQQYESDISVHTTTISYHLNGGNIDGQTSYSADMQYGGYLSLPVPEKDGYVFEGWYATPDLTGNEIKNGELWTSLESNSDLYAKWREGISEYTITYHPNGGSMDFTSQTYTENDEIVYPIPEKSGYRFMGWYHDAALSNYAGILCPKGNTGDLDLYARWDKLYYITYVDGYDHDSPNEFIAEELPLELSDATRDGYRFMGWYKSRNFTEENKVERITEAKDITLYAYWEKIYTISFDSNGGTSVSDIQGIAGQEITLPSPTKYKHIGTWKSWGYLTNDETISNFGYSYTIGTKDEEFEAVWKSLEYEITFDQSGGTGGTTSKDALVGEKMPSITLPSRTGYTFSGYYDEDIDKCYYTSSGAPMIFDQFKPVTLTARWSPIQWTVIFQTYIGTNEFERGEYLEMTYDQPHPVYGESITAPDIEGYTFVEWRSYYAYFQINDENSYTKYTDKTVTIFNVLPVYGTNRFLTAVYQPACVAEGTLITLADGSQKAVEDLTGDEMLLVWDLYTGTFGSAPILFIDSDPVGHYQVIRLFFSDGTTVDVISEHGFFDIDLNEYVYLDKDAAEYIGHDFWKQGTNGMTAVTLVDVEIETEVTVAYSPVTYGHLCYYVNGMLSVPGGIDGLFNIFEVDAETMTYDAEGMAADIEEYGLYTYEELNALVPMPKIIFDAVNGQYLKVAVGKGIITVERMGELVQRYAEFFE